MTPKTRNPDPVLGHLLATASLFSDAMEAYRQQVGEDAHRMALAALRGGSMLRATTTLSLAGAMAISLDLIAPNGEVINLGNVDFDGDPATLN